ncbi:MAG: hypothetical protein MOIL_01373 [Candidatus Methanolliviera sp. GoM_oil]|nr:MAG: hypothetical protein MOIL_01373 [Candidatus Methanolliviera sp. GoM_oil]
MVDGDARYEPGQSETEDVRRGVGVLSAASLLASMRLRSRAGVGNGDR